MKVAVITIEAPMPGDASHKEAVDRAKRIASRSLTGVAGDCGARVYGCVTGVTTRSGQPRGL